MMDRDALSLTGTPDSPGATGKSCWFRRLAAALLVAIAMSAFGVPAGAQVTAPTAPTGIVTQPGDRKMSLNWKPRASDGGAPITGFEYQYKAPGDSYPPGWTAVPPEELDPGAEVGALAIVFGLVNGTVYNFRLRAVNSAGAGTPSGDVTGTPEANTPSTFQFPPIEGIPRLPVTVSMEKAQITDGNGMALPLVSGSEAGVGTPRYRIQWQWLRVTDGVEREIPGAVSRGRVTSVRMVGPSDYTLTPADVGSQLKARMRFRDDAGNEEEHVSPLFPSSGTIRPVATCPAPRSTGGAMQVWSREIPIGTPAADLYGVESSVESDLLDDATFTMPSGYVYKIDRIIRATGGEHAGKLLFGLKLALTAMDKHQLMLHVCDEAYPLRDATLQTPNNDYEWPSTADWSTQVTRTIYLSWSPPTLSSAFVEPLGQFVQLRFSENLRLHSLPRASAFTVTADGRAVTVSGVDPVVGVGVFQISVSPAIRRGQAVVVTYTDPTAGDDAKAIQDRAGNDVASFTTGSGDDPAVTNNSTVPQPGQTTATFGAATYVAIEGGADATVTVELSAAPARSVEIPLVVTRRGGATAGDYTGYSGERDVHGQPDGGDVPRDRDRRRGRRWRREPVDPVRGAAGGRVCGPPGGDGGDPGRRRRG